MVAMSVVMVMSVVFVVVVSGGENKCGDGDSACGVIMVGTVVSVSTETGMTDLEK